MEISSLTAYKRLNMSVPKLKKKHSERCLAIIIRQANLYQQIRWINNKKAHDELPIVSVSHEPLNLGYNIYPVVALGDHRF